VRAGDYKLIEHFEDGDVALFNLRADISERRDLSTEDPQRAARLHRMLVDWRAEVSALIPKPNPSWDFPPDDGEKTA